MRTDSDYVVLTEEPNLMRAHWIAGGLEAVDIPTFVDEDNLADEFAMSQKMMGVQRVRVLVPGNLLEEARQVFLSMSQPLPLVDEDEVEEDDAATRPQRRPAFLNPRAVIILMLVMGGLVWLIAAIYSVL